MFDINSRPGYHFLPQSNWMNDPNGPFYDSSTSYHHLFYQYLTPRVWGHAISSNLVDWEILPIALNYTDESYTEVPGETPGVYSGSATILPTTNGKNIAWLSASTPTNDMVILAYPTDILDEKLIDWTWYDQNPVVYSNTTPAFPPGRDPTEFWKCGTSDNKYCLGYATQLSEGCPCSGVSGIAIFSSSYDGSSTSDSWNSWTMEGYILNDTANAVMWECPDLFPLFNDSNIWMVKYSIGPGPSFSQPWGTPGPRDYYITGSYNPQSDILDFRTDNLQWNAAMNRSSLVALDVGAFYASKTYHLPGIGRVLWGWIPEERLVDSHGNPYGWAGVMALPRLIVPYQLQGTNGWYIRTPPLSLALDQLYIPGSTFEVSDQMIRPGSIQEFINDISGNQLEILLFTNVDDMFEGDVCGIRVLSSLSATSPDVKSDTEFTDIGIRFRSDRVDQRASSLELFVDTQYSTANTSSLVNRTVSYSYPLDLDQDVFFESTNGFKTVKLHVLLDHSVIESFLASGSRAMTRRSYPTYPLTSINLQLFSNSLSGNTSCHFPSLFITKLRNVNITEMDETNTKHHHSNHDDTLSSAMIGIIVVIIVFGLLAIVSGGRYWMIKRKRTLDTEQMLIPTSR